MAYDNLNLRYHLTRFDGGLATQEQPNKIEDNQSPDMVNVKPLGRGAYGPRNGISRVGDELTSAGSIRNIYNFERFDRTLKETLVRARGTTLEYLNSSDVWTAVPGVPTYTENEFGFAHGRDVDEAVFYLYGGNGVDNFFRWDGGVKTLTTFTAVAATDVLTSVAHGLANGDRIYVSNSGGGLPGGLSANTPYYVIEKTDDTFKLAASFGGSAIDITSDGTGTNSFSNNIREYSGNPKGNIFEFFAQSLFVTGDPNAPATVRFSVVGAPDDFASAGSGDFVVGDDGDKITSLKVFQSPTSDKKALFVFKRSTKIYFVVFDEADNLIIQEIKRGTGAVNNKSTILVENNINYIDQGNNIVDMGFRENIPNELRTDPQTSHLDTITSRLDFDNACAVYWKNRRLAMFAGQDFGSDFNDTVLVFFYDFNSWWRWTGINANEFAIYQDEVVWASSADPNVYKYDEEKFDDLDGQILSYHSSKDIEYLDENGILLSIRYKKARFAIIKGFISEAGNMDIEIAYDGNLASPLVASFSGTDEDKLLSESIQLYMGSVVFGFQPFGGALLSSSDFPMREFMVIVSLDAYSNLRCRITTRVQDKGTPYIITHKALWSELQPEEQWADGIKI